MKKVIYFMFFVFALSTNMVFAENDNDKINQNEMLPIQIEMIDDSNDDEKEAMIKQFILSNRKYFKKSDLLLIQSQLKGLNTEQIQGLLMSEDFVNPTVNVILSVLVGELGVDRFVIGQVGYGVLKLLTFGGLGIWTIVDWFQISGLTKKHNAEKLMEAIMLIK